MLPLPLRYQVQPQGDGFEISRPHGLLIPSRQSVALQYLYLGSRNNHGERGETLELPRFLQEHHLPNK